MVPLALGGLAAVVVLTFVIGLIYVLRTTGKYESIHDAAAYGDGIAVRCFLLRGGDVCEIDSKGYTVLHSAAVSGNTALMEFLLSKGLDVNAKAGIYGLCKTPLHVATMQDRYQSVRFLLEHGADTEAISDPCNSNSTALHIAAQHGRVSIGELLIDHGADIHAKTSNNEGWTPLRWAVELNNDSFADMLRRHGAKE